MTIETVFRGTPYSVGPNFDGTVIIYKEWPGWQKNMWYAMLGEPPATAWKPTFEQNNAEQVTDAGTGKTATIALNERYFATAETAAELMKRYGAIGISLVPFTGAGGNVSSAAQERWLIFPGCALNAGKLAAYFVDNPEDSAPGDADKAVRHDIDQARSAGQQLPASAL